jgi:hypothetical protein
MIKDVRGSEVVASYFMVLCQCVPNDTEGEHKEALLGQSDSVPRFKIKGHPKYKEFYIVLPSLWYT